MPNMTLSVTDVMKRRMRAHPSVKWSNVVRSVIERKLDDFEEAEMLAKKSRLSMADFEAISGKIDSAAGKHARALLNESNS